MRATPYHEGRHLPAESLTDATGRCPACGDERPRKAIHRVQRDPDVDLLQCAHCGIASASMMPTPRALEDYYAEYYDARADAGGAKTTFGSPERFAHHIVERLTGHVHRLRVLDFGGGDGSLALAVARRALDERRCDRVEVVVVDHVPPVACDDTSITIEQVPDLNDVDQPCGLVIASAILEHIPEVGATLRRLFDLAAPGALFYARTPYWAPMLGVLPRIDLTFPGHVHDIGAPFWNGVTTTFAIDAVPLVSQPSIVETELGDAPLRTLAAHALKLPSRLEVALRPVGWRRPWWGYVGGWEIFLCFPR